MSFANDLLKETNKTARTENYALSNHSTLSHVLDFFSKSGALRGKGSEAVEYFSRAFVEDKTLALRAMFYMRDIRGGQGERENFRSILKYLGKNFPRETSSIMKFIPEFGRWDDLYAFVDTPLRTLALDIMKVQFYKDLKDLKVGKNISLIGKWLKSENTSSQISRQLGKMTREYFGMRPRQYRKVLTDLRNKISIVETFMSKNNWKEIDFGKVPSQASRIYSDAFRKHDESRYNSYINKVLSGEVKINASTTYPYEIIREILKVDNNNTDKIRAFDAMWNSLPNYATEEENSIVVVDTSGSMYFGSGSVYPICVALSLGVYFAERMTGPFKDHFITFSESPKVEKIIGNNIYEKIRNLMTADWGMSTNLQAVFRLLLDTAKKYETSEADMPKKIYIISDMQFNQALGGHYVSIEQTNFEAIDKMYRDAGYERPQIVFWNVNTRSDSPVTKDEKGTFLVSGCSPSILKHAVNTEAITPYDLMMEVLNSERYQVIN